MSYEAKPKVKGPDVLKVTNQYRDRQKHGMVYELRCGDATLELFALQRPGEWRFEGRSAHDAEPVVIGDWRGTLALALEAVGTQWESAGPALGLPAFDWAKVAVALAAVQAT